MTTTTDAGTAVQTAAPDFSRHSLIPQHPSIPIHHQRPASPLAKSDPRKWFYLAIGIAILFAPLVGHSPAAIGPQAVKTLAIMATTVLWWVTETFPVPITALMIPVLVHLTGVMRFDEAIREGLGTTLVPFTLGVLGLSAAFTESGLGKRITYRLLTLAGTSTRRVIGVFLWLPFLISMFMDDLAVVAMMLPLVLGMLKACDSKPLRSNFGKALMMAIIFGSTLGGIATPAGVSANIVTTALLSKNANVHISFLNWMLIGTPVALLITLVTYGIILHLFPPEIKFLPFGRDTLRNELLNLGKMKTGEITTLAVALAAVALWLSSDWTKLPTALVSLLIIGGISLPQVGVFRNWRDLSRHIEWGAILLLAGGFVVGVAASKSGLASWIVHELLQRMTLLPRFLQPGAIVLLVALDSLGLASFGTTASVNVPFIIAYAQQNGFAIQSLGLAAGFASSIHFVLVTQSPSITLPYTSGYFRMKDLTKLGILVTLVAALIITAGIGIVDLFPAF